MSSFRNSRLPLLVACAAFALSGCMQSTGPVAKAPRGDLDALAYGELQAPQAKVASTQPARGARDQSKFRGGFLEALGVQMKSAEPAPMESNAQIADAQIPVMQAPAVQAPVTQIPVARVPVVYSAPPPVMQSDPDYKMDSGDKLRIVVYGQEGLTNTYAIDAGGGITMPLIGRVVARGMTPAGLAAHVTARLRKGYIREPSVAVEVETYRPFFILGEVAAPGQYPYVPNMSVEAAVAIAGGFSPRARRDSVMLTQKVNGGQTRAAVPLGTPLSPGDTVMVGERWF